MREPGEHYERIDAETPPLERLPHEARYRLAAGWLLPGDRVLDAACGTGYGAAILEERGPIDYLGIDRSLEIVGEPAQPGRAFREADLEVWGGPPDDFDVAIVFETLEHLERYEALVEWTWRARRLVILSVPTMPSAVAGGNPYHRHDFRPGDIANLYANMKPLAYFEQPFAASATWVYGQW